MYLLQCADTYQYARSGDIYMLNIIPLASGLAATASDQSLLLLDPLKLRHGPLRRLRTDHGNLTAAKVVDLAASTVCTTGENGSISIWDLRADQSGAEALKLRGNDVSLLSIEASTAKQAIVAGTEFANHQAEILIWDVRQPSQPQIKYSEVHSDDITELVFHPTTPDLLLSGSTDGLINICDTRIADEDEVVVQTFNHGSVHRACFLNATEIFAVSHDEQFALYDMAEDYALGSATQNFGDIRQVLGCQYIADVFPKLNGAGAIIGAGTQDQQMFQLIHMNKGDKWTLDQDTVVGLPGAHGEEIVRSFCFSDKAQVVFTAGEDGAIKAWRPGS